MRKGTYVVKDAPCTGRKVVVPYPHRYVRWHLVRPGPPQRLLNIRYLPLPFQQIQFRHLRTLPCKAFRLLSQVPFQQSKATTQDLDLAIKVQNRWHSVCFFGQRIVAVACTVKLNDVVGGREHIVLEHGIDQFPVTGSTDQGMRVDVADPPQKERIGFPFVHLPTENEDTKKLVDVLCPKIGGSRRGSGNFIQQKDEMC